jgi:hypothetical protein
VAKKNEALLCQEYINEIEEKLSVKIFGSIKTFKDLFAYIMNLSKNHSFSLIIDEF